MRLNLRIEKPCAADWALMTGSEQSRFCTQCGLHVHNFVGASEPEILKVLQNAHGKICARVAQPAHMTTPTQSIRPVGWWSRAIHIATAALAMLLVLPPTWARQAEETPPQPVVQVDMSGDRMEVRVLNRLAEPIHRAVVEMQSSSAEQTLATATTDRHGRVNFERPQNGSYMLVVRAPLLMTYSRVVTLEAVEVKVQAELTIFVGTIAPSEIGIPIDFPFGSGPRDIRRPQANLSK